MLNVEQALLSLGVQFLQQAMSNPDTISQLLNSFGGCHTASDVAQDALDAWENGQLTREQALRIVQIALEDKPAAKTGSATSADMAEQILRAAKAKQVSPRLTPSNQFNWF